MKGIGRTFDLETFLSSVNGGRSLLKYGADEIIFAQGDPATRSSL